MRNLTTKVVEWHRMAPAVLVVLAAAAANAGAQVDQQRAAAYFREAAVLCERDGGKLWGVSLCGPMAFADPVTKTIATNQPQPSAPQPPAMGFANSALDWGGTRWSIFAWWGIPRDNAPLRARLMMHELFHRIQPQLGLLINDRQNEHLDTPDGRYWIQLEWRALARALGSAGAQRDSAARDALAFRQARHRQFPGSAENERVMEINEGLAQYTGTVSAYDSPGAAIADAIRQLDEAPRINETLIRTFPYPPGAAYGLLLDAWSPGWTRRIKATDDIARMLAVAAQLEPIADAESAASRYDGRALRAAETKRETERAARVAELRRRFVEGPVLVMPNGKQNSFVTNGMTPIPGEGTIYPTFRSSGDWGSLDAVQALMSTDQSRLTVPAPASTEGSTLTGEGWTLTLAPGWTVRRGARAGDWQVVRAP
jgi:hypothetical protein